MKISVVGIGRVGSALAFTVVIKGLADELVLVHRTEEVADGEARDLAHASAFADHRMTIRAGQVEDTSGSDVVVVCASVPQPRDIADRAELGLGNTRLFRQLIPPLAAASPEAILLVVTNPVDVMTYFALQWSGFPASRVLGTGTLIDSGRFRALLSAHANIHPDDLRAYILGEHGDTQFPALSLALTGGEPIPPTQTVGRLFDETVRSGYEVVQKKGFTNYAVALAAGLILESIVHDERRTMPVSTLIDGYLGVHDVCLSVPAVVGRAGIARALEPPLSADEVVAFHASADTVRQTIVVCQAG